MIDTKDLMIGNCVKVEDHAFTIKGVNQDGYAKEIALLGNDPDVTLYAFSKQLNPHPVTPELLERIGFEKTRKIFGDRVVYAYHSEYYHLDIEGISDIAEKDWYIVIHGKYYNSLGRGCFQYLHELQNLVRVITGHDLPITKEMLG